MIVLGKVKFQKNVQSLHMVINWCFYPGNRKVGGLIWEGCSLSSALLTFLEMEQGEI